MKKNITISLIIFEVLVLIFGIYLSLQRFFSSDNSLARGIGELLSDIGIVLVVFTTVALIFTLLFLKKLNS